MPVWDSQEGPSLHCGRRPREQLFVAVKTAGEPGRLVNGRRTQWRKSQVLVVRVGTDGVYSYRTYVGR